MEVPYAQELQELEKLAKVGEQELSGVIRVLVAAIVRNSGDASLQTLQSVVEECTRLVEEASSRRPRFQIELTHLCQTPGCADRPTELCKNNPQCECSSLLFDTYKENAELKARCGEAVQAKIVSIGPDVAPPVGFRFQVYAVEESKARDASNAKNWVALREGAIARGKKAFILSASGGKAELRDNGSLYFDVTNIPVELQLAVTQNTQALLSSRNQRIVLAVHAVDKDYKSLDYAVTPAISSPFWVRTKDPTKTKKEPTAAKIVSPKDKQTDGGADLQAPGFPQSSFPTGCLPDDQKAGLPSSGTPKPLAANTTDIGRGAGAEDKEQLRGKGVELRTCNDCVHGELPDHFPHTLDQTSRVPDVKSHYVMVSSSDVNGLDVDRQNRGERRGRDNLPARQDSGPPSKRSNCQTSGNLDTHQPNSPYASTQQVEALIGSVRSLRGRVEELENRMKDLEPAAHRGPAIMPAGRQQPSVELQVGHFPSQGHCHLGMPPHAADSPAFAPPDRQSFNQIPVLQGASNQGPSQVAPLPDTPPCAAGVSGIAAAAGGLPLHALPRGDSQTGNEPACFRTNPDPKSGIDHECEADWM